MRQVCIPHCMLDEITSELYKKREESDKPSHILEGANSYADQTL